MAKPVFSTGDVPTASQVNDWFVNILFAKKPADEDRSSTTTFADDTNLTLAVQANSTYEVRSTLLVHSSSAVAGDFKMKYTGPTGAVLLASMWGYDSTATTANNLVAGGLTLNTTGSFGVVAVAEPWNPVHVHGTLVVAGTAGNFVMQWAQNTSSATVTRLKQYSFLMLTKVE